MFKNKKFLMILSAVMIFAVALTGCGQKAANEGKVEKDTLVVAQGADAKSLDPHATNDQPSSRVMKQIYDTLVKATVDMELVPGLAESWKQLDETTWQFNIRKGVKFHNGEELKASDVKFTLERMLKSQKVAHIVEAIDSVEVKDDYTVIIKTKEPFGPLLAHLSHTAASILNEKAVKEAGDNYGQHPIGTGPYKFVSWEAGDRITLERFDDYYQGPAKIKNVVFRNITEGTNRTIGLETGEVDIAYDIEPIDKDRVANHEKLQLIEGPSLSYAYIGMNMKKAPFDNPKVRKAINYAINVDDIITAVLNGAGQKANSPIGPRVFGYNGEIKPYDYNPELAKKLLKEAGYENGFDTTIWTNDNPIRMQIAQIVQAQLKEVGINVTIEPLEWGSYLERTAKGEHDMFILGWTTVTADADYGLYALYHSSQHGGAGNRTFYTNEEVDKLLEKGRTSIDPKVREEAYKKAQEIIVNDAPDVMLYYGTQNAGIQKSVKGFKLHPAGHHSIYGVYFE
ncbi:peptide/nickel transport system substrate-binding protein [Caminicella sporogenes DSM 14501]|uniref:Peptide/nickel transport system substrate-binding protein n=1 Tax=Caminicella sporogenes DSM 14501 TaxID=1121266 RepID=A0A1M6NVZ4_9FIRM|nr:glutathione ABC transporter substrate-binding protein [Caminicella sporogenes]RKD21627.1 diguanylate phosphodiesterase [Caminicella sporogenes]WIF94084.1 glutathione ABC transporter substrate-binding protein [Caminicella sporogenes]SHJ99876.1 peptide/nickel transport system substrate-binding protein [Caminicella sporogenes DSM 14501]